MTAMPSTTSALPFPSPSPVPSVRTFASTTPSASGSGSGSASFVNHSPARPTHAQRGVRTNASSIHLSRSASVSQQQLLRQPDTGAGGQLERSPSLSFLTHDPATAETGERERQRWSNLTATTGMADHATSEESGSASGSGMAVRSSSPSHPSGRSRSVRSVRSALSAAHSSTSASKARKRASGSTIHRRSFQRKYGRWEVEMISPLLVHEEEERLELEALLGRATVLERLLRSGKRISGSGTGVISLPSSLSLRRPSTKTSITRHSLSISICSVRRRLRRNKIEDGETFTEIDSQSGLGSAPPHEVVMLTEKERGWVVLIPEEKTPPPVPEKDQDQDQDSCSPLCLSFPSPPTGTHAPSPTHAGEEEEQRRAYRQSPHLGHRSPSHHQRQSVLSYISVGRWSASTQGRKRRRMWILWISIVCIVGIIVLVGILAGLLSKRSA